MMNETTNKKMHSDHAQWHADDLSWKTASERWLDVCELVLTEMRKLESEICDHVEAIQLHQDSIKGLEHGCEEHERIMAIGSGTVRPLQDELAKHHTDQADLHSREHSVHRKLEARQRQILSSLSELPVIAEKHAEPPESEKS